MFFEEKPWPSQHSTTAHDAVGSGCRQAVLDIPMISAPTTHKHALSHDAQTGRSNTATSSCDLMFPLEMTGMSRACFTARTHSQFAGHLPVRFPPP
eukprot:767860-Hanusia_phi.AAC.8